MGQNPIEQRRAFDADLCGDISNGLQFSVEQDAVIASSISALHRSRGPPAVSKLIVAVIVDALNLKLGIRLLAHVSKEVLELQPSVANLNAATAIVLIALMLGIKTPFQHVLPRIQCRASLVVLGVAMRG